VRDGFYIRFGKAADKNIQACLYGGSNLLLSCRLLADIEMERNDAVQEAPDGILVLPDIQIFGELSPFNAVFEYSFDDIDRRVCRQDELLILAVRRTGFHPCEA